MRVLIVEDDYLEEDLVRGILKRIFKIPDEEIRTISTEGQFRSDIDAIAKSGTPPDLVIMDVMMRWTDPAPQTLERRHK